MREPDRELVRIVGEDLRFLRTAFHPAVSDEQLRRLSTVLRRVLVEGDLRRVWNATFPGEAMLIVAPDLRDHLGSIDPSTVGFASAGGADMEAGTVYGVVSEWGPANEDLLDPVLAPLPPVVPLEKPVRLSKFIDQTCLIIRGRCITRQHVVQYVSNKLGGAHFDSRRAPKEVEYAHLDEVYRDIQLLGRDVVYGELLATGQLLAKSPDAVRLADHVLGPAE